MHLQCALKLTQFSEWNIPLGLEPKTKQTCHSTEIHQFMANSIFHIHITFLSLPLSQKKISLIIYRKHLPRCATLPPEADTNKNYYNTRHQQQWTTNNLTIYTLFNVTVLTAEVIYHRIIWEKYYIWCSGKDFEGSSYSLLQDTVLAYESGGTKKKKKIMKNLSG